MLYKILIISIFGLGLAGCSGGSDSDSEEKMADKAPVMAEPTKDKNMEMAGEEMDTKMDVEMAGEEMDNKMDVEMAVEKMDNKMDDYTGGALKPYDPDVPSMVVEDNNAVQKADIYKK